MEDNCAHLVDSPKMMCRRFDRNLSHIHSDFLSENTDHHLGVNHDHSEHHYLEKGFHYIQTDLLYTDHDHVYENRHHDHFEMEVLFVDCTHCFVDHRYRFEEYPYSDFDYCTDRRDYYDMNCHYFDRPAGNWDYTDRNHDPNRSRECLESFYRISIISDSFFF